MFHFMFIHVLNSLNYLLCYKCECGEMIHVQYLLILKCRRNKWTDLEMWDVSVAVWHLLLMSCDESRLCGDIISSQVASRWKSHTEKKGTADSLCVTVQHLRLEMWQAAAHDGGFVYRPAPDLWPLTSQVSTGGSLMSRRREDAPEDSVVFRCSECFMCGSVDVCYLLTNTTFIQY